MSLNIHSSLAQAISFGGGIFLHIVAYKRGEWDLVIPKLLFAYGVLLICAVAWTQLNPNVQIHEGLSSATCAIVWLAGCHAMGITLSMVVYRLLFHRLRHFPGPFWARITNIYHTVLTSKKLHLFEEVEFLHHQYGDFIRIGD
jgi:hypothetical protein